ncbi:hypothetical protein [Bradyrhizobium japonicum]|uniref:hypothetical protein n=1 Tax=Bradyrhizobium japonicum TaxID=375 RepID=UPI001269D69E|nr:hypothetical protein [Bradyrhizobium japonicum]
MPSPPFAAEIARAIPAPSIALFCAKSLPINRGRLLKGRTVQAFIAFCIANPMLPATFLFGLAVVGWLALAAVEYGAPVRRRRPSYRRRNRY